MCIYISSLVASTLIFSFLPRAPFHLLASYTSVFGLGFLRSVATKDDYVHFTTGMYHYYGAMEERLGKSDRSSLAGKVWQQFPELPRQDKIQHDLKIVGAWKEGLAMSPATEKYVNSIHTAADEEGGARLLGHLYVRYFADLFGGRALGAPTRLALKLPETPHFYVWDASVEANRREYIERLYVELNVAGEGMEDAAQRERVVDEARLAFAHNASVYVEQVPPLLPPFLNVKGRVDLSPHASQ